MKKSESLSVVQGPSTITCKIVSYLSQPSESSRTQENFRTTKPQEPLKLTLDNAQLSTNRDIGKNMSYVYHEIWLRMIIKDITGSTLRTLFYS
jgi:hypothetical protein